MDVGVSHLLLLFLVSITTLISDAHFNAYGFCIEVGNYRGAFGVDNSSHK